VRLFAGVCLRFRMADYAAERRSVLPRPFSERGSV
jgi:hypothetical protein